MRNILKKLIVFNPKHRCTASECLKDPYFDDIRQPDLEMLSPFKILIKSDVEAKINYQEYKDVINAKECIKFLENEINLFRKSKPNKTVTNSLSGLFKCFIRNNN